jgi:hypothetical protein
MATNLQGVVLGTPPPGIPHLSIPFALLSDGTAATLQQGTSAEIVQCVANLVGTRPGTRFLLPAYGVADPTFGGLDPVAVKLAAQKYEKRAAVAVVSTPGREDFVTVDVSGGSS